MKVHVSLMTGVLLRVWVVIPIRRLSLFVPVTPDQQTPQTGSFDFYEVRKINKKNLSIIDRLPSLLEVMLDKNERTILELK